jgi:hypothetical protein
VKVPRVTSAVRLLAIYIVLTAGMLEVALRVQQKLGPLYDLEIRRDSRALDEHGIYLFSYELNHVPAPGPDWDADGIRAMDGPNAPSCARRLLFMGDSFMQALNVGRADTVPVRVRDYFRQSLGRELCVFNAGYSSYSPSIYIVQAKKLIPLLHPDIVLIDIDETDIYDDYYRYRELSVRDESGSIAAVRPTPTSLQYRDGMAESTEKPFYVQRALSKVYFREDVFPRLVAAYNAHRPPDGLFLAGLPAAEVREKHAAELAYFTATLDDLTRTVRSLMGSANGLIYLHHPHLEHLTGAHGAFNDIVSTTLTQTATRYQLGYYDATADLRTEMAPEPEKYYQYPDMHFNARGSRAFGIAVAKYLATVLNGK